MAMAPEQLGTYELTLAGTSAELIQGYLLRRLRASGRTGRYTGQQYEGYFALVDAVRISRNYRIQIFSQSDAELRCPTSIPVNGMDALYTHDEPVMKRRAGVVAALDRMVQER